MNTKFTFEAIGTHWEIEVVLDHQNKDLVLRHVKERIGEFDKNYSRFRADSLMFQICNAPGSYPMPSDFSPLFSVYKKLNKATNGLFTPLIGDVLRDAGYDENYSFKKRSMSSPKAFEDTFNYKNNILTVNSPVMLDFGAGGKGHIIDIIGNLLKKNGITDYCIDAGGDILKKGSALKVGLENPLDTTQVIGSIALDNNCICGSAGNRRKWNDFHHIINPKTLTSPTDVLAVWVIADTALIADAMSTALFLKPDLDIANTYPCEFLIMFRDSSIQKSDNFKAELYYKEL